MDCQAICFISVDAMKRTTIFTTNGLRLLFLSVMVVQRPNGRMVLMRSRCAIVQRPFGSNNFFCSVRLHSSAPQTLATTSIDLDLISFFSLSTLSWSSERSRSLRSHSIGRIVVGWTERVSLDLPFEIVEKDYHSIGMQTKSFIIRVASSNVHKSN